MFLTACQYPKVPHLMAILKRTSVIIAGHHGVYVRLPSEHSTEPIHRFAAGGITEDWLLNKNKPFYGRYKQGVHQKYEGFEDNIAEEQELVAYLLGTPEEKEYIERARRRDQWRAEWEGEASSSQQAPPPAPQVYYDMAQAAEIGLESPQHADVKDELVIKSPETKKARIAPGEVIDVDAESPDRPAGSQLNIPANIALLDDDLDEEDVFQHGNQLEAGP
eukprot:Skav236011  [mRNA]  locus=scaffold1512:1512:2171:+ [translate_table: standard]